VEQKIARTILQLSVLMLGIFAAISVAEGAWILAGVGAACAATLFRAGDL